MLENDFKGLEEVASIVKPLNVVFTITNLINLEEVEISIGNILNNHPLLSILQVSKVDKLPCNDFKEMITMSLMDLDKIHKVQGKFQHLYFFHIELWNWMYLICNIKCSCSRISTS